MSALRLSFHSGVCVLLRAVPGDYTRIQKDPIWLFETNDFGKGYSSVSSHHINPHVLAAAARIAGVSDNDLQELSSTASKAWVEEGSNVYSEAIELKSEQIEIFGFVEDWRSLA